MEPQVNDGQPVDGEIERQAVGWLILLQEEPENSDLRRGFEAWLQADPRHALAWQRTQHALTAIAATAPRHDARWRPFLAGRRAPPARLPSRRHVLRTAALAAGLGATALLAGPELLFAIQADHRTGTAEMRSLSLPDGSRVTLAPHSAIALAFSGQERGIHLLSGEAFFDVMPDAGRPFRIQADGLRVTVLGTAFSVRNEPGYQSVGVEHGLVQVDLPAESRKLSAGRMLLVGPDGRLKEDQREPGAIAAWRQHRLIARDEPLAQVVDGLRRYYSGQILITDAALGQRPVTGLYDLRDPVRALQAIARAQNAVIRQISPWLTILSAS